MTYSLFMQYGVPAITAAVVVGVIIGLNEISK